MITPQEALEIYKKINPSHAVIGVKECDLFYSFVIDWEKCPTHEVTGGAYIIYKNGKVGTMFGRDLHRIPLKLVFSI